MLNVAPGSYEELDKNHNELGGSENETESDDEIDKPGCSKDTTDLENSCEINHHLNDENVEYEINNSLEVNQDSFVLVQFQGKKKMLYYVGLVVETKDESGENSVLVKFLKRKKLKDENSVFVFPDVDDISLVNISQISEVLPRPSIDRRGHYECTTNFSNFHIN